MRAGLLAPGLLVVALIAIVVVSNGIAPYAPAGGLADPPKRLLERAFADSPGKEIPPDFQFRGSIRYLSHHDRSLRFEGGRLNVFLGVAY